MKVLCIIQARMGSTRLPKKVLSPLGNTVLLDYVYRRSLNIDSIDDVIVATTSEPEDDPIEKWCFNNNAKCFRGSKNDVLQRFGDCIRHYQSDYIVRVTGDCPFISIEMASNLIRQTLKDGSDYGRVISDKIAIGLKVSIIKSDILLNLLRITKHPYYREHITLYLDDNLSKYNVTTIEPIEHYKNKIFRLTVDTEEDLTLCRTIVDHLGYDVLIPSGVVLDFLSKNPHISKINKSVKQKNIGFRR